MEESLMKTRGIPNLIIRLAREYGVPIGDAFDAWVEADGNVSKYEKLLQKLNQNPC